jgi:hypothetical protein
VKKRKPSKPITTEKAMNNFFKELRRVKRKIKRRLKRKIKRFANVI